MEFKNRLRQLREENELLQKELAEKIGVSRYAIIGWESGKREPNMDKIIALAKYFNVSIDYLLGYSEHKQNVDSRYRFVIQQAELAKLKPSDLQDLIKMIQKFQDK